MRPVQYFSKEYLAQCRKMTPEQIVEFLENFRELQANAAKPAKSRLISLKVPEPLLASFKTKARLSGVPYQTQIKRLMTDWAK
jgi:predicted DNA binding CopG/RHH family protein